jgi:hypothetical protein
MNPSKEKKIVIENRVSAYCESQGIDRNDFLVKCLQSKATIDGRRLTAKTAESVFDGETGITLRTAALVASALGVDLEDIFKIR